MAKMKRNRFKSSSAFKCWFNIRGTYYSIQQFIPDIRRHIFPCKPQTTFICIKKKHILIKKITFFLIFLYITNVRVRQILNESYDKNPTPQENILNILLTLLFFKAKPTCTTYREMSFQIKCIKQNCINSQRGFSVFHRKTYNQLR